MGQSSHTSVIKQQRAIREEVTDETYPNTGYGCNGCNSYLAAAVVLGIILPVILCAPWSVPQKRRHRKPKWLEGLASQQHTELQKIGGHTDTTKALTWA